MDMLHPITAASLYLLNFIFVCITLAWASDCPPDALVQAKACTAILGLQPGQDTPSEFIKEGDGQKAYYACGNGDLLNAISCQERILERCKSENTDSAHYLRNMIDIDKARSAVTYFCTNVAGYMKNAKCIAAHQQDQVTCAQDAMQNFRTQLSATSNKDALLRFQCRFYFEAVRCMEDILMKKCSSYVADIVTTIMIGFEPPICNNTRPIRTKARNTGASYDVQPGDESNDKRNSASHTYLAHVLTFVACLLMTCLPS